MQLSFNLTDRVVDLVREGYDLSIRIGGAVDPNFVAVKLASNRRVVCGTPEYFRQHGRPKSLDDLLKHNCLAFNLQGGQNRGWYFQRHGKIATMRVAGNLDCNDGELLHRWVAEGLGLGWRSTWEIAAQLETGELETVLDEYALPDYDILAVYPQQRYVPARVRYFIDYLRAAYAAGLLEHHAVTGAGGPATGPTGDFYASGARRGNKLDATTVRSSSVHVASLSGRRARNGRGFGRRDQEAMWGKPDRRSKSGRQTTRWRAASGFVRSCCRISTPRTTSRAG